MRRKILLLTCALGLLLSSGRDASAFWKYIGELSGPGPFWGMDFIFPWSLSSFKGLTNEGINHNRELLRQMGIDVPLLEIEPEKIPENQEHCAWLSHVLALDESSICATRARQVVAAPKVFAGVDVKTESDTFDRLVELTPDKDLRKKLLLAEKDPDKKPVPVTAKQLDDAARAGFNRDIARQLRRFGAAPAGIFSSKQTLPVIRNCVPSPDPDPDPDKCRDQANNWFFNFTLGIALSLDNKLEYAPDFDRDKDVVWLTVYPNFERRFRIRNSTRHIFFWNAGVTVNRFLGAGFEDFTVVSGRTRGGFRLAPKWLLPISFGLELDWYPRAFRPEDFGALPDDSDRDHLGWAGFVAVELTRDVR